MPEISNYAIKTSGESLLSMDINMNCDSGMKALYIVVCTGFAEQVVEYIRDAGSGGATVINARGISSLHKEIMGISIDKEKEMIVTITDDETAEKIMDSIKKYIGFKTEARGVCFSLPVTKAIGLSHNASQSTDAEK